MRILSDLESMRGAMMTSVTLSSLAASQAAADGDPVAGLAVR